MGRAFLGNRILFGLSTMALLVAACSSEPVDEIPDVERVEWTIEVSEYAPSPGTVTLKGDVPLGFPTETWKEDVLLARTVDARAFEWNMDVSPEVPIPVNEIDEAGDCDELQTLLEAWADATASAPGEARRAEAQAFAQHALDTMLDQGCEVDAG
jgi:hypothetical protein